MTEQLPATTRASRWRFLLWLVIFLLGVLIGWLLAHRGSAKSCSSGAGSEISGSPSQGSGTPGHPSGGASGGSPDSVNLTGSTGDRDQGTGLGEPGGDRDVGGGGRGHPRPSDDDGQVDVKSHDRKEPPVAMPAPGATLSDGPDQDPSHASGGQVLKANDFRYDKTGLPRYSQSVTSIGSTLAHDPGASGYKTTCGITTSSKFQEVVAWYKEHLPAGWQAQTVDDLAALAQQVSIENIMKSLTASAQTAAASSSGASAAALTGDRLSVAMFSPPPGTSGEPSVMIQEGASHDVVITMSRNGGGP